LTGRVDLAEFLSAFVAEADEQLVVATAKLLAIEQAERKGARDPRGVRDAFRALHTIKGLSSMVGVDAIVSISHAMESVLRPADRAGGTLPAGGIDPLVKGVRAIELRVRSLERGESVAPPPDDLLNELDALVSGPASGKPSSARFALDPAIDAKLAPFERELLVHPTDGRRAVRIDFAPSPDRAERGLTINSVRDGVGALAEIVRVLPISVTPGPSAPAGFVFALLVVTAAGDAELIEASGVDASCVKPMRAEASPSLAPGEMSAALTPAPDDAELDALDVEPPRRNLMRVNVARVDDAMDRLGALLVTRARLTSAIARLTASGTDTRELAQVAQENARQLRDLRSSILQVRMVPVIELFERLPLIVRALRRTTGKGVALKLDGGGAELDKAVADLVFPALVHLVRNAVDHGIETPEVREKAGKPAEATLRVGCVSRSSTGVVISVEDDGRGIDAAAVLSRAGRAAAPGGLARPSDVALLDLICQPGLTTREEATTTSGRGLGMDIVKRIVVDQLGGELVLHSEPGKGTVFTLHIPLTVAIIDAFVVECGAQRFAVPVSVVEEVVEIEPTSLVQPPRRSSHEGPRDVVRLVGVASWRREALSLYELVASGKAAHPPLRPGVPAMLKALVVRRRGELSGLVVDRVVGQQEAVVRPLVDPLVRVPGVAGATELGDGRATLVLDVGALTATVRRGASPAPALGSGPTSRRLPAANQEAS
jgi:two-component system chemotaxis sensor kinase CheA